MKRHPALIELSREHHTALKLSREAKRCALLGLPAESELFAKKLAQCFTTEIAAHFTTEERDFLPLLEAGGLHALIERTLSEHAELRHLIVRLQQEPLPEYLARFGDLMEQHVRFEERELFAAIELVLDRSA